ncbi:hypothetical protein RJ53_07600 [Methanocalculus chunghsingensis]|uniref:Uncharacterized protein n=1 Tax=Methanocalculus chunghsingensis TaxID=156457 RepID=A0A8J7WAL9_9EURY|nr:hypothetical protein [Methanocalculus chunghsingensis]
MTNGSMNADAIRSRYFFLTSVMQQTSPSFSESMTISRSPGVKPARSRTSFGRTIWPRASMVTIPSTEQEQGLSLSVQDEHASSIFIDDHLWWTTI